jgi:hypothetical protein
MALAPAAVMYVPTKQLTQLDAPPEGWNWPAGQPLQPPTPAVAVLPAAQLSQLAAPEAGW